MASEAERNAMRRAVAASAASLGTTNPNPTVGAVVIAADGEVLGEGVTQPVGGDHAEVGALRSAGGRAQGATLIVTLEPCSHTGRTGPCTEAIQAAGIARVIYAHADPSAVAAGGGEQLRAAGIDVEAGVLAAEAAVVLGPWATAVARGRPHVTWKYAATLDGHTAAVDGSSKWITGDAARRDVHRERLHADAVIAGVGTVLADDPHLTVRDWPGGRQPLRVVVDTEARTPLVANVLDPAAATVIAVAADAPADRVAALQDAGVELLRLPRHDGRVDLASLLDALFHREVALAFLEGGPTLAASFVRAGLVDRVLGYYAPLLLGGGLPLLGDIGVGTLTSGATLQIEDVSRIGDDVRIVATMASTATGRS